MSTRPRVAFRSIKEEEQFLSCLLNTYAYFPEDDAFFDTEIVTFTRDG